MHWPLLALLVVFYEQCKCTFILVILPLVLKTMQKYKPTGWISCVDAIYVNYAVSGICLLVYVRLRSANGVTGGFLFWMRGFLY